MHNRREMLRAGVGVAAVALIEPPFFGANQKPAPQFLVSWTELAIPDTQEQYPMGWGTFQYTRALEELSKLGATISWTARHGNHYLIRAQLLCKDFAAADTFKHETLLAQPGLTVIQPGRTVTRMRIAREHSYRHDTDRYVVRWTTESGYSWWNNWPERPYKVILQRALDSGCNVVSVQEQNNSLTRWTFEEVYLDQRAADDRLTAIKESGRYIPNTLKLFAT